MVAAAGWDPEDAFELLDPPEVLPPLEEPPEDADGLPPCEACADWPVLTAIPCWGDCGEEKGLPAYGTALSFA